MKPNHNGSPRRSDRAYTLIETLVASSILMIGVSAAASMSLAFVTQEEITERAERAFSHLENAATLFQCGVDPDVIPSLLPPNPTVTSLTFLQRTITEPTLGPLPSVLITVTWKSSGSTDTSGTSRWTGGRDDTTRTASVEVIRSERTLPSPLPRVDFFD